MDKKLHNDRTGVDPKPYTPLDELMLDIEGRDSNYMVGLGLADNMSQSANVSNMSTFNGTQSTLNESSQSSRDPPVTVFTAPSDTPENVIVSVAGKYELQIFNSQGPLKTGQTRLKRSMLSGLFPVTITFVNIDLITYINISGSTGLFTEQSN